MNDQTQTETPAKKTTEDAGSAPGGAPDRPRKQPWYKRPAVAGMFILAVIVLVVVVTLFWIRSRNYEKTDDAYIDTPTQQVSAQVEGRIVNIRVEDNQVVAAGDVLVELDPANFNVALDQAVASAAQAETQVVEAQSQRAVYAAQLEQAKAALGVAKANAENARSQLDRTEELRSQNIGAVSQEQVDNAVAAQKSSAAQVEAAVRGVAAANAQLRYSESLITAAEAGERGANARVAQAKLNLSYTQVKAEIAGTVTRKQIAVGNFVQPGAPLMAIVPETVYVTANFKENQLARMRRGQTVEVHVDAFPERELHGHVDSFQTGTGQAFSGLPAENATGNWVKVVQRVPVKILLDDVPENSDRRLGPGLSVEVKVKLDSSK